MRTNGWITCVAFVSFAVVSAESAESSPPSPYFSTAPPCIALVGSTGGVPDSAGEFYVTVRDMANNPYPGRDVVLDFSQCPDLRIASTQPWPGVTVDCTAHTVIAISDAQGRAHFRVLGGAANTGASPGAGLSCLRVFAFGVLLSTRPTVQAYDQDGEGGLGPNDVSALFADLFSGSYFGRSDYDCSQTLGSNDLSLWLSRFFAGGSATSASPLCAP